MLSETVLFDALEPFDSLFVAPHGDDVPLSCPARVRSEAERGRRVLVLALFEPVGGGGSAADAVRRLGAFYEGGGLTGKCYLSLHMIATNGRQTLALGHLSAGAAMTLPMN